jgi:hypothetical protein
MLSSIIVKVAGMEKEERGIYYPRPSLSGPERCIRQMVYWASGYPEDQAISDRFIMTMDDSTFHELLTQDWISKSAFSLHSVGMEVMTDVGVGHIDGIITDMLLYDRHYEHKALNHFAFEKYWLEKSYPLDYFTQSALYLKGLRKDLPDLTETILLIKNKNTSQYIDYVLQYVSDTDTLHVLEIEHSNGKFKKGEPFLYTHENICGEAVKKFNWVAQYKTDATLPERPYDMDSWRCGYCSYNVTCWKDYNQEFESLQETALLSEEVATTARYYLECKMHMREMNKQVREMEKESDDMEKKIISILKENKAKIASAGEYRIESKIRERRILNKELIPEDVLKKASRLTSKITITITKPESEGIK